MWKLFKWVLQCCPKGWAAYCSSDMLVHSCINVKRSVSCDWTVAGLQSFVSRLVSYWFKRPKVLQMICSPALYKMKGAGLSVSDLKVLFHVMQINFKMITFCSLINKKHHLFNYITIHKQDHKKQPQELAGLTGLAGPESTSLVFVSGDFHVRIIFEGLPVTFLKCGTELLSRADLVGVRELLSLRPLVDLVEGLLPLHRRHHLLHQLPAHVALVHVALAVHVGVHVDLRTTDLNGREVSVLVDKIKVCNFSKVLVKLEIIT